MIVGALTLAVPAFAESFSDPVGDNTGLDSFGHNVTVPDMTFAAQQLLDDGRVELIASLGPTSCATLLEDGTTETKPARGFIALYTASFNASDVDFRIAWDGTRQTYVIRTQYRIVSVIDSIESGGTVVVRFLPRLIGSPTRLRWIASQHCRGDLPNEDVDIMPDSGYFTMDLPATPTKPAPSEPPIPQGPDPLPDAPVAADTSTPSRLAGSLAAGAKQLVHGIPRAGLKLSFSGLPAGSLSVTLKHKRTLARGTATTQQGRTSVRLALTAAGRRTLKGTGTVKATLTILFTPSGGGTQTKVTRQVSVSRRR